MENIYVLVEVDCKTREVTERHATAEELNAFRVLTPPSPPDGRGAALSILRGMTAIDPLVAPMLKLLGYSTEAGDGGPPD